MGLFSLLDILCCMVWDVIIFKMQDKLLFGKYMWCYNLAFVQNDRKKYMWSNILIRKRKRAKTSICISFLYGLFQENSMSVEFKVQKMRNPWSSELCSCLGVRWYLLWFHNLSLHHHFCTYTMLTSSRSKQNELLRFYRSWNEVIKSCIVQILR